MSATDDTDAWVKRVNDQARELVEAERAIHPSAWPTVLATDVAKFKRIAASGPTESRKGGAGP